MTPVQNVNKIPSKTTKTNSNDTNTKQEYTLNDIMKKLMEMDNKYTDLLNKYEEQVKVNEVLKSEILIIKWQLGKEQNKNEQNEMPTKVCFTSEKEKEEFLGARKKKMITSKDLGYEEGNVIYLNHDLTKANQYLFKEVLIYKKENEKIDLPG
ncbi:hypothetical protein JTB14_017871 [Gonioctena quinquepunctata]|nr:hypothetical protein JTB14_017871 [Gonioctena quinquepunctata]